MSLRRKLFGAGLWLSLAFALSGGVLHAQQPGQQEGNGGGQPQRENRMGGRHGGPGRRGPGGVIRLLSQLNLTDAQQQQVRAIRQRFEANTRTQREELRKLHESNEGTEPNADAQARMRALRAEIEQAMRSTHEEMLAVLTAEQRTQLEQLVKEQKARRKEMRGRRQGQQNEDNDQ